MEYKIIEEKYKEYLKKYDHDNELIKIKFEHVLMVAELMEELSKKLGLSKEEIFLSKVIGLFHDIGRFEQVKINNNFDDVKYEHGEAGANYLFKTGNIRKFLNDDKYDDVIYHSIKNHNKFKIEENLDDNSLKYSKMIRDMDKVDIYRVISNKISDQYFDKDDLSLNVRKNFLSKKSCLKEDRKTYSDQVVFSIAFIFDFNYKEALEILRDKGYFDKWLSTIKLKEGSEEEFNKIKDFVKKYIKERFKC